MPVCQQCSRYVANGRTCPSCLSSPVIQTAIEPSPRDDQKKDEMPRVGSLGPIDRPPVPRLFVLDDDSDTDGECFRLRQAKTAIGRREGTIQLPHDPDVSSLHAVIVRTSDSSGSWRWRLVDQESKNRTFVRVDQHTLSKNDHFRIADVEFQVSFSNDNQILMTSLSPPYELLRVSGFGPWTLGSDAEQSDILVSSVAVNPVHATLSLRNSRSAAQYDLADNMSRNGIWINVQEWDMVGTTEFILGQQRFRFELPRTLGDASANE